MLASCYVKLTDDAGYVFTLDKFLAYYPTKEYWADAIRRVESKPGFSERHALDVLRLRHATGTFGGADSYVAMTQRSMAAALPAEAKRDLRRGIRLRRARHGRRRGSAEAPARRRGEAGDRRPETAARKAPRPPPRRAAASRSSMSALPT